MRYCCHVFLYRECFSAKISSSPFACVLSHAHSVLCNMVMMVHCTANWSLMLTDGIVSTATDVVTVYVFQEPSLLSSLQDKGLTDVVLQALLVKDVSLSGSNLHHYLQCKIRTFTINVASKQGLVCVYVSWFVIDCEIGMRPVIIVSHSYTATKAQLRHYKKSVTSLQKKKF